MSPHVDCRAASIEPAGTVQTQCRRRVHPRTAHQRACDHGGGRSVSAGSSASPSPVTVHHVACRNLACIGCAIVSCSAPAALCPLPHRSLSIKALLRLRTFITRREHQVIHSHGMCGWRVQWRTHGGPAGEPAGPAFIPHGVPVTPDLKHRLYQLAEHAFARPDHLRHHTVSASGGHRPWPLAAYRGRLAVVPNRVALGGPEPHGHPGQGARPAAHRLLLAPQPAEAPRAPGRVAAACA